MADRDTWEKAESLSKIFAAVFIPVVLGVASLLANQVLEADTTQHRLPSDFSGPSVSSSVASPNLSAASSPLTQFLP